MFAETSCMRLRSWWRCDTLRCGCGIVEEVPRIGIYSTNAELRIGTFDTIVDARIIAAAHDFAMQVGEEVGARIDAEYMNLPGKTIEGVVRKIEPRA